MARSRRSRRTLTVIVLVVLSLSLISLDLNGRTHSLTSGVKSVANDVYSPLRQGVLDIISPIGNFFAGAVQLRVGAVRERAAAADDRPAAGGASSSRASRRTSCARSPRCRTCPSCSRCRPSRRRPRTSTRPTSPRRSRWTRAAPTASTSAIPVVGAGGPGRSGDPVVPPHLRRPPDHRRAVQGRRDVRRNQLTGIVDGQGPSSSMTADLVAPHTPLHKGEVMFTSSLDAAAFPPGIPVATRADLPHRGRARARRRINVDPAGRPEPAGLRRRRAVGALDVTGRSMLRVALVIFIVLMVQQTVMVALRIGGAHPDLLWLLPITAALLDGPETGAIVGFWAGLAFDLVLPTPFGLSALVGCVLGYAIGALTTAADPRATWLKPVAALAGSVAADMLFAVLGAILGQEQMVQVDFLALFLVVGDLERGAGSPGQPADAVGPGRGEQPPLARPRSGRQQDLVKRTLRHPIRGDRLHPKPVDALVAPARPGAGTAAGRACGRARASTSPPSSARPRRRRPGPISACASSGSSCCSSSASSSCGCGRCRWSRGRPTRPP